MAPPSKRRKPISNILEGTSICLIPLGILGRVRVKILHDLISSHGGGITEIPNEASHILVPENRRIPEGLTDKVLLSIDWLSDTIKLRTKQPEDHYRIIVDNSAAIVELEHEPSGAVTAPEQSEKVQLADDSSSGSDSDSFEDSKGVQIADIFERMASMLRERKGTPDEFRARNYAKAARIIRKLPDEVWMNEPGILREPPYSLGVATVDKVKEFIETGKVGKFNHLTSDERLRSLAALCTVHGIGRKVAEKLYTQGVRSIGDLSSLPKGSLTRAQEIGLKYWEDFQVRIPRAEVMEILKIVKNEILNVFGEVVAEAAGSFRRGAADCGDVDIIICSGSKHHTIFFEEEQHKLWQVVENLSNQGFIVDKLNLHDKAYTTFMGVCRISEKHLNRRIDLKLWPQEDYAFALLHFTGNDHLNRLMRYIVKREGYKLTDHGLFQYGQRIHCESEEEIFKRLRFEYLPPERRQAENLRRLPLH